MICKRLITVQNKVTAVIFFSASYLTQIISNGYTDITPIFCVVRWNYVMMKNDDTHPTEYEKPYTENDYLRINRESRPKFGARPWLQLQNEGRVIYPNENPLTIFT